MKKKCSKCKIEKDIENFYKNSYSKSGYRSSCKDCKKQLDVGYYLVQKKEKEKSPERRFVKYKYAAKTRDLEFTITFEQFKALLRDTCLICNSNINIGVDRLDSSKGYIIENCISCCDVCNKMKLDHSFDFFIKHIKKIYDYNFSENWS